MREITEKEVALAMAKGKYAEWLTEDALIKLRAWARDGLTDEQIAAKIGIGYSTLQAWKSRHQDIQDALKKGKEVVDALVENALLKRALGYTTVEEILENIGGKMTPTKTVKKEVPPDTTAQIFWLKNRKRSVWCDQIDISTEVVIVDDIQ